MRVALRTTSDGEKKEADLETAKISWVARLEC